MKFIDEAKIYIESGRGGDGIVSFAHTFAKAKAGPDGGDGGNGGRIIFVGEGQMETLLDYRYRQHFRAKPGKNGGKNNCRGKNGEDRQIKVPLGTAIKVVSEEAEYQGEILQDKQQFIALEGGRGGHGNTYFKSSRRVAPRECQKGEGAKNATAYLNLQLIADVGLLGLPSCGKSTLINALTGAKSRSGAYPFTTLRPQLGVLQGEQEKIVIADLPGLIAGAANGVGLGIKFLKHAKRTKVFVHLLDLSLSLEQIIEGYQVIRQEVQGFSGELAQHQEIVVGNKLDLCEDRDKLKEITKYFKQLDIDILTISALKKIAISKLEKKLWQVFKEK